MENWDPKTRNQFKKQLRELRFTGIQNGYTKQLIANREAKAKAKEEQKMEVVLFMIF